MGMSLLVLSNKASLFLNQYVNPIAMDAMGWKYYCIYIGWIFLEFLVVFCVFPETEGYALEEVSEIFEGKNAAGALRMNKREEALGTQEARSEVAK
jgi:hypothetical protein